MDGTTPPTASRPQVQVQVDPTMTSIRESPQTGSPQSAIIDIPAGWIDSPASGSRTNRGSMDIDPARRSIESNSSAFSSPSQPTRSSTSNDESSPYTNYIREAQPANPFDATRTFAEDPFAQTAAETSPSDDDGSSRHNSMVSDGDYEPPPGMAYVDGRRGSMVFIPHTMRSTTDPLLEDGHPVDPELAGQGYQQQEGYDFEHPQPPAFTRTFSAPLPQRVGYLRHPHTPLKDPIAGYNDHPRSRHPSLSSVLSPPDSALPTARPTQLNFSSSNTAVSERLITPLETVSLELADGLQSAIQTLLHLSPPHLLDNAKEQYSGCTVQVPSTSLSALMSSMRGLNYLSANARALCEDAEARKADAVFDLSNKYEDFDIGELLQSVADLLCGQAAQAGVDFVLFHGDVGIKHVSVRGNAEGLAYALGHVVRQVLLVAQPGDTIELGLQVFPQSPSLTPRISLPLTIDDVDIHRRATRGSNARPRSPGRTLPSPPAGHTNGPLLCIFEIVHNINQTPGSAAATPKAELNPFTRLQEQAEAAKPNFDTVLCRRLLSHQNASLKIDAQPSSPLGSGMPRRAVELSVLLSRGGEMVEPAVLSVEEEAMRQPFAGMKLAREPTLGELSVFAESLRGKKVTLHASLTSLFARHLTSYLAAWGLDISHIPIEDAATVDTLPNFGVTPPNAGGTYKTTSLGEAQAAPKEDGNFVIIDDDVAILRRELTRIRLESPVLSFKPRLLKRPTMASRTRSSPQVRPPPQQRSSGPVIIHFTSLSKYNHVRDTISSLLGGSSPVNSAFVQPEVIVIPKPVGPRRFLTALHTAANQPVVDPFFSPIATSPRSPGGGYFSLRTPGASDLGRDNGYFEGAADDEQGQQGQRNVSDSSTGSQKGRSPLGEYPPSQASVVRTEAGLHLSIPTPGDVMATPAHEYFESAVSRASSGSGSAVIMQSPDGRPMGMFFEPPNRDNRRVSYNRRGSDRRMVAARRASGGGPNEEQAQGDSPRTTQTSRRSSQSNEGPSRRGSLKDTNALTRAASRRKTLPTPTSGNEPILAMGRERSSTNTSRTRGSQILSPVKVVGGGKEAQAQAAKAKASKSTGMPPIADAEPVPRPKSKSGAAKKTGQDTVVPPINVLIVEDNPINQNILSMFLRKKKINHQTAKDGLEAVEKWRTGAFHLILMDIQLPVMDGIEATKEIRKLEKMNNIGVFPSTPLAEQPQPLPQIRETSDGAPPSPFRSSVIIVALTASSLQSDRVVALAAGCNDFLTKPVSLKWLEKKIIEWGCMQALIDFEGWKRWKGTDKDNTKQGFQLGPQRAARDIAGKLHIDRKGTRTPPAHAMSRQSSSTRPDIQVRSATPQSSLDAVTSPILDNDAANSLSAARSELAGRLPAPPGPDAASSVVPTTTETAHAARQLQQSTLSAGSASPTSPTSPPSSRPPKSRPTTPKQEGRISSSSSLHSIHEALEPSAVIRSEKERSPESPFDKPLPALPQGG